MKKTLLCLLCLTLLSTSALWSQCVPTCSSYAVSSITYTTFPAGTTNLAPTFTNSFLGSSTDDGSTGPIPIGFSFNYFCNSYTSVHICTNGFIVLNYMPYQWVNQYCDPTQSIPNPTFPNGMIAFNMTDLDLTQSGAITYTTVGVSPNRMFVVTFSNVPCFSTPSNLNTGQIVLYETSNIIEIYTGTAYPDTDQGTLGGTQGIENTTGSIGVTPPGRNANNTWGGTNASNTAYQFSPYTPSPPTSITGNTLLCQGQADFWQASYITSASRYNWALPGGWLGTSTLSSITATSGVSGSLSVTATYTCGTSAPTTLNVSVTPAPVVSISSATPMVLCSGKTVTFNTAGALTYTLNPGFINGVPTFTDIVYSTTIYSLSGTNAQGCVSTNNATVTIIAKDTPTISVNSGTICLGETFTMNPTGSAQSYSFTGGFSNVTPTVAGQFSYSVTGTATNFCVSDPVVSSLTVFALPTISITASRTIMCLKESITMTATGASSYLWGNQSVSHTISVSPTTGTFYVVTGTDSHGCSNSNTINIAVKLCTGIEELTGNGVNVSIYPNPTNGTFVLKLNSIDENTQVEVYNSVGQLITTQKIQEETTTINLRPYSNGLYYVKVKNTAGQETLKLLKE